MAPRAHIAHRMVGRARLRIPSKQGDASYFNEVERALGGCPAVEWVSASSITAGLLIYHKGDVESAMAAVIDRGLFELSPRCGADELGGHEGDRALDSICDELEGLDSRVGSRTRGAMGINTMLFYGLLSAAAYQALRGKVLPPAGTLLYYAVEVLFRTCDRKSRGLRGP